MKKSIFSIAMMALGLALSGCDDAASVASRNVSKAADNFEVYRRVVFVNGITDGYLLSIEGLCSIGSGTSSHSITVTCKTDRDTYKKHILGLSDNVTYFAEQLGDVKASEYRYRVVFRPSTIIPSVEMAR